MHWVRTAVFVLALGLLLPAPAQADGGKLPKAIPETADAVEAAVTAKDEEALLALARREQPDPWGVADELCRRGAFDAAVAFAEAAPRPTIGRLAAYIDGRRKAEDEAEARKAVQAMVEATRAKDRERVVELAPVAMAQPETVQGVRAAYLYGLALFELKKAEESLKVLETAGETALKIGWGRWASECFHQAGMHAYTMHRPLDAMRYWKRRLEVERELKRTHGVASALGNLGILQQTLGQNAAAIQSYQEVLGMLEKLGDKNRLAGTLNNLGVVLERMGDFEGALEQHNKALALKRPRGNKRDIAGSLRNIGGAYEGLRKYERALAAYEESLALEKEAGNQRGIASSLNGLGTVQERLANYDAAIANYEASLAITREVGDKRGIAATLNNLGVVHLHLRRYDEALKYYEDSLELKREMGDRAGIASTLSNIGNIYEHLGRLDEALPKYEASLAIDRALGNKAGMASTLNNLGVVQRRLSRLDEARATLEEALRLQEDSPDLEVLARASWQLALVALQAGDPDTAVDWVLKGIDHVEEISQGLAESEGAGARDLFDEFFQDGFRAAALADDADRLTTLLERGRASGLRESLGSRAALEAAVIPAELREALHDARQTERKAVATYASARATRRGLRQLREARANWDAARTEVEQVSKRIERAAKRAASVTLSDPDDLKTIQSQLADGEALVYYALTFRDALALVVRRDATRIVPLGPSTTISKAIEQVLTGERHIDPAHIPDLRRLLVEPLALERTVKRVLVSPSGRLGYVPFALLFPEHEIAYAPSGTSYGLLGQDRALRGQKVLGFGDPAYGTAKKQVSDGAHRGDLVDLPRLPATRQEVEAIADVRYLGERATETGLQKAIAAEPRWRAVHFACHGIVDPERPMLSSLALTPDETNDGFVRALDIFRMKIPADLVVLSACETGKGKIYKTEGIVGLTRSFMFAGSPRVICSLWQVDDEATRALMVKFYELWNPKQGKGLGAAAALKQAQAHVRAQEKWSHPYFWAAWVLWGLPE